MSENSQVQKEGGIVGLVLLCPEDVFSMFLLVSAETPEGLILCQARLWLKPMRCGGGQGGFLSFGKMWGLDLLKLVFLRECVLLVG